MRDPERIDRFCDHLKAIWHTVPDLRFGQMISNAFADIESTGRMVFYMEDDEMLKYLDCIFSQGGKQNEA